MTIYFYTTKDKYGEFSNFSKHGIEINGYWWKTTEHYFQAQKFDEKNYRETIRNAHDAKTAANLGRSRKVPIKSNWETIKDDVMRTAVLKKFQTHTEIKELLLSTGSEKLIEAAPDDYYWGAGTNGSGKNRLGEILEEVRDKLRNKT